MQNGNINCQLKQKQNTRNQGCAATVVVTLFFRGNQQGENGI